MQSVMSIRLHFLTLAKQSIYAIRSGLGRQASIPDYCTTPKALSHLTKTIGGMHVTEETKVLIFDDSDMNSRAVLVNL